MLEPPLPLRAVSGRFLRQFPAPKSWSKRKFLTPVRTYSGKTVYKRKKRYFTIDDAKRISRYVELSRETLPGLIDFLDILAKKFIARILSAYGFKDEFASVIWNWLQFWSQAVVNKIIPESMAPDIMELYKKRLEAAIADYQKSGSLALLQALLRALKGQ